MKKIIIIFMLFFNLMPYMNKGKLCIGIQNLYGQYSGGNIYVPGPNGYQPSGQTMGNGFDYYQSLSNSNYYYQTAVGTTPDFLTSPLTTIQPHAIPGVTPSNPIGDSIGDEGGDDFGDDIDWEEAIDLGSGGGSDEPGINRRENSCPSVLFREAQTEIYGFDNSRNERSPWISVEQGQFALINVDLFPVITANQAFYKSLDLTKITVSPTNSSESPFDLTVTAAVATSSTDHTETTVRANCRDIDGDRINSFMVASYTKKTKTVAIVVVNAPKNEPLYHGINSPDINLSSLDIDLNKHYYNQAVINWTVTELDPLSVAFDEDENYKLEAIGTDYTSSEMQKIIAAFETLYPSDDHNEIVFLVDGFNNYRDLGFTPFGKKYCFVNSGTANPNVNNTIAHELGHGVFSLVHDRAIADYDSEDMMWDQNVRERKKFRKYEWDIMHP